MKGEKKGLTVNAVARAVRILKHLSQSETPLGAIPVARELQLNPSTCFNLLRTLTDEGLVDFEPMTKGYSIGTGLVTLSKRILEKDRAIASFEPTLRRIARAHDVTTVLVHRATPTRLVIVLVCMSDGPLRIQINVGQRLPLLTGASGRVIAAFSDLDPVFLRRQFQQVRWGRPYTFEAFQAQVAHTRRKGWAVGDLFFAPGAVSVAVPVFDRQGRIRFACTAVMFNDPQQNTHRQERVVRDLLDLTRSSDPRIRGGGAA